MAGIIRNRGDWEKPHLQKKVLSEVQAVYKLREALGCDDLFQYLIDFVMDQFPVYEKDMGDKASDEWWDASLEFEKKIAEFSADEFYQLATHKLDIERFGVNEEEEDE